MVADAAVGAAGRAWRAVAGQIPEMNAASPDVQDWAIAHTASTVGFAVVSELRATAAQLGLGQAVFDLLDLSQRQMLAAHQRSCLVNTLNARCLTPNGG